MASQSEKIIARFAQAGVSVRALADALGMRPAGIYRWTYPRERGGTGGYVPTAACPRVKGAADLLGVVLTPEDWAA